MCLKLKCAFSTPKNDGGPLLWSYPSHTKVIYHSASAATSVSANLDWAHLRYTNWYQCPCYHATSVVLHLFCCLTGTASDHNWVESSEYTTDTPRAGNELELRVPCPKTIRYIPLIWVLLNDNPREDNLQMKITLEEQVRCVLQFYQSVFP